MKQKKQKPEKGRVKFTHPSSANAFKMQAQRHGRMWAYLVENNPLHQPLIKGGDTAGYPRVHVGKRDRSHAAFLVMGCEVLFVLPDELARFTVAGMDPTVIFISHFVLGEPPTNDPRQVGECFH